MILPLIALSLLPAPAVPPESDRAMPGHDDTVVILACLVYEAGLGQLLAAAPAKR